MWQTSGLTVLLAIVGLSSGCYLYPADMVDPCADKACLFGSRCVPSADGHYAACECEECPNYGDTDESQTVCGSDGKLYRNKCELNRHACQLARSVSVKYLGKCGESRHSAFLSIFPYLACLVATGSQLSLGPRRLISSICFELQIRARTLCVRVRRYVSWMRTVGPRATVPRCVRWSSTPSVPLTAAPSPTSASCARKRVGREQTSASFTGANAPQVRLPDSITHGVRVLAWIGQAGDK